MTFTDEDMKRLKEGANDFPNERFIKGHDVLALIARLEAAENVCYTIEACLDIYTQKAVKDSLKDWRKAAGK